MDLQPQPKQDLGREAVFITKGDLAIATARRCLSYSLCWSNDFPAPESGCQLHHYGSR
jgi:hypothetical protein